MLFLFSRTPITRFSSLHPPLRHHAISGLTGSDRGNILDWVVMDGCIGMIMRTE